MSWNGSGVFNRIYSWVADKNAGIDITASRMDADTNDITSNGFGNTLTRDGQGSASANLPMNNFRHTGAGNAQARTDYAALAQVQDGVAINWTVAAGTADALTVTYTPAITALVDGQLCFVRASAANATTTPTFAPNGLTAHTITKLGGTALAAGDIPGNLAELILRYNLANTRWELLNPGSGVVGPASAADGDFALFNGVTGKIIKSGGQTISAKQLGTSTIPFGAVMLNGTLVQSQAGNAQTFAIKTLAAADPSATDPVYFLFRDVTIANGDYLVRTVTAVLSITIPSTKGIGFSNATPGRVWIGALDNAGTVELFVLNALNGTSIYPLRGWGIISTSAVSGATAAAVAYSTTARTSVPYLTLGYAAWEVGGTLGTAGTWNVTPTRMALFQPGQVALPGTEIQAQENFTGAQANGSTAIPLDDTIPQITEGNEYMTQAITPTSSANLLRVSAMLNLSINTVTGGAMALFQDATANALATAGATPGVAGAIEGFPLEWSMRAATLSSTTFRLRVGSNGGNTYTFNGSGAAREYGGSMASFMRVREIMA